MQSPRDEKLTQGKQGNAILDDERERERESGGGLQVRVGDAVAAFLPLRR